MNSDPPTDDPLESLPLHAAFRELALALEAKREGRQRDALRHAAAVSPLLIEHITSDAE